ncbi:MAG TPA: tetratricopeptide repeat protein [Chthoniobacterales bacterium]
MKVRHGAVVLLLIFGSLGASLGAEVVAPTKAEVEAMYTVAAEELNAGNYAATLKQLDAIDAREPDVAAAQNLRGVALMRMGEYGRAEKALQKARELDPNFWEARFNLAEIPFLEKNWAEARDRFAALAQESNEKAQGATGDLIQFKILLTWLLQGKATEASAIRDRLTASSQTPAGYYAKAAFAFKENDETGARVNLRAAEKAFPARLNKLFAESLYEVGWMEKPDGATPVALEVTSQADRIANAKTQFADAERAWRAREYEAALQLLDKVEEETPNQAVTYNLRGEVLLEQGKLDQAETAFRNAIVADPQFTDARFNLARLPFKKRQFEASRREFESLLGSISGDKKERRREQLIRYQIYLTLLLEGRDAAAQKALEEFKMMDDTPALYYAQAAWAFQHGNPKQAGNWIANAGNLFSPELNRDFAGPLTDAGWLNNGALPMPSPAPIAIAATTASPAAASMVADTEMERATPAPSAKPQALAIEKKATSLEKEPKRRARDETASRKSENVEPPAHRQPRRKSQQRIARAKAVTSPIEPANRPATSNPPPPAPMPAVTAAPARENLGDKVRHLFVRAFGRRTPQNATPSPAEPPR